jgi:hypothetical protein
MRKPAKLAAFLPDGVELPAWHSEDVTPVSTRLQSLENLFLESARNLRQVIRL